MRFSTTPAMVVEAAYSSKGKRYSFRQFKTFFGGSTYVTAIVWDYMFNKTDTVNIPVVQDLLKDLYF